MTWKPWDDYKDMIGKIPVNAPPCVSCEYWQPVTEHTHYEGKSGLHFDGIRCCHAVEMQSDFSCYRGEE